jgi:hypothetical protein
VADGGRSVVFTWNGTVIGDFTFTALNVSFTVANAPPGSLLAYGPVNSYQTFSFGVGGSGPNGTPDQIVMQLEPTPPACSNGIDDDGDGFVDYPADVGCASPTSTTESPRCNDGRDDDGDGKIDFDGGAAANHGVALGPVDPQCNQASRNSEAPPACGFGAELVLLAPVLRRLANPRRSAARA